MSDSGSKAPERAKATPSSTVRTVLFAVVLAFIVAAPLSRQFLGVNNPHLRAWVMFSGIGLDAMDVRFFERHADGSKTELEPFSELGRKRPGSARQRRLKGAREVRTVARKICQRRGVGMDLRVIARRATTEGWVQEFEGRKNLCERVSKGNRRARPHRRGRP